MTPSPADTAPNAYPLLLDTLLRSGVARAAGHEIVHGDVRYGYRDLSIRVARLANVLVDLGVGVGQTVGMLDWDSHRYLESYFAVPGSGAVLHTVNIRLSPEQILYTINHARDDFLLVHVDFLPMLADIWPKVEGVRSIVLLTDDGMPSSSTLPIAGEYERLLAQASTTFEFPDLDENSRATTFYTTGTTGSPKGVFFSHRQLVLHTLATASALASSPRQGRLHRADVYMPITPMFHVHAWGLPFVATMLGLKQVYPGRYDAATLLGLRERERISFSHCVPTLLHMLLTHPASAGVDLNGWKIVIGGSALPQDLARAALDRGIDVFAGYGMSETCPILTLAQLTPEGEVADIPTQIEVRSRAGTPIPLVDLRLIDADMSPLPHDGRAAGEIVVRSPWLTQGYLHDPENSALLWRGGRLHTNDVGVVRPDGTLQITDRIKDVIKTGGEWISSLEIEDLISRHPDVVEAAVIAAPDERWGERPVAIIVAAAGREEAATEEGIRTHLESFVVAGRISRWAVPNRIVIASAIDKTSVGKIDKKALRARYL